MKLHLLRLASFCVLAAPTLTPTLQAQSTAPSAGAIQFADPSAGGNLLGNNIIFAVSRGGGSAGAVSVTCSTVDGTGKAGVDYTATTTTLSWADGDTTNKNLVVPFLNRGLTDGTTISFSVRLSNPTGGATLGAAIADIDTLSYPSVAAQPTITITSPPADITLVSGAPVTLAASVVDPGGILSEVQFYLNGLPQGRSASEGPFTLDATAPDPGTYVLMAVATDSQGRESTSTRKVTVVAADPVDPAPDTALYTNLDDRQLAGGSSVVLTAMAASLRTDGTPLREVDFYADNTLIASYDGQGNLLSGTSGIDPGTVGRRTAARRTADSATGAPASKGSVLTATWTIPNLTKLINLITVATSASGRSQVSASTSVQAVATTASSDHPPMTSFKNVGGGQRVRTGVTITVPVDVTDPDAAGTGATGSALGTNQRPRRSDVSVPSGLITQMDYYLNQVKIGTSLQPPYSLNFTPPAEGTYVLEAIATDGAGLSGVAAPLIIDAVSDSPSVSVTLSGTDGKSIQIGAGGTATALVTRANDDLTEPLTVNYKLKGDAVSGVDFKMLSGTVTIPAGATKAKIKIHALDDGMADGDKSLKLKVAPSANGIYAVGVSGGVKVILLDH